MNPLLLRFSDRTMQGRHFHLTTVEWARNRLPGYHTHDYHEVFWLTRGACEHAINGRSEVLEEGSVVLMRPADAHQLKPAGGRFQFTNLSIAPASFERLKKLYPEVVARLYRKSGQPLSLRLSRAELEELNGEARTLAGLPHGRFALERAVMNIWHRFLSQRVAHDSVANMPEWLQAALLKVQEPEYFSLGAKGFVSAAGRSHEHVTRACRQHLGKTPTQLVNEARMRRAAHSLRMTSLSVLEIALDCGFENPAQFHRLFRAAFRTTPGRYRRE